MTQNDETRGLITGGKRGQKELKKIRSEKKCGVAIYYIKKLIIGNVIEIVIKLNLILIYRNI